MVKQILLLVSALVLVGGVFFLLKTFRLTGTKMAELKVGSAIFRVEIADTPAARAQGLSGRAGLNSDQGMLFIFEEPDLHKFWMKGVSFPLDFIWIRDNKVVGATLNALPESGVTFTIYSPPEPADKVLEISGGIISQAGIRVGDLVELK